MKKYVFPTLDDLNDGCGVIVGNLFVTAAHVVEHNSFYLPLDDKTIELKKEAVWMNTAVHLSLTQPSLK